ncbi:MAG: DNA-binding NarL/FixJ family response regulator [Polyangiales bacterium]
MLELRMIRVLIADDHTLLRKGLVRILDAEATIEVVGEASNGREALLLFATTQPDVLVLDIVMPEKDGLDVTKELLIHHPDARILVLSAHEEVEFVSRLLQAGAKGFLPKDAEPKTLVAAVTAVATGGSYLTDEATVGLAQRTTSGQDSEVRLSDREFQVMRLIAAGTRNRVIATMLHISNKTVDTHRARVLQKLGLETNADIARYAVRHGLVAT